MKRQIALLIDLLGFSDAVLKADTAQTETLLSFVQQISTLQGPFKIEGGVQQDGRYVLSGIRPEVTTFSDLLFASFPLDEDADAVAKVMADVWLQELEKWTGVIAAEALKIGMLIRGGLTLGPLRHDQSSDVTFGPALIEAHELEARDAIYPRVILSGGLLAELGADQTQRLLRDKDGWQHLDYYRPMFDHAVSSGPEFIQEAKVWLASEICKIEAEAARLSIQGRIRQAAKWEWFKSELSNAAKRRGIT